MGSLTPPECVSSGLGGCSVCLCMGMRGLSPPEPVCVSLGAGTPGRRCVSCSPSAAGTRACQGVCEGGTAQGAGLAQGRAPVLMASQPISLISPLASSCDSPRFPPECPDVGLSLSVVLLSNENFLHAQQELDQALPQRQLEDHRRVCTAVKHIQNSPLPFPFQQ